MFQFCVYFSSIKFKFFDSIKPILDGASSTIYRLQQLLYFQEIIFEKIWISWNGLRLFNFMCNIDVNSSSNTVLLFVHNCLFFAMYHTAHSAAFHARALCARSFLLKGYFFPNIKIFQFFFSANTFRLTSEISTTACFFILYQAYCVCRPLWHRRPLFAIQFASR